MEANQYNIPGNASILDDYMRHLKLSNRSDNTLETYGRFLNHFMMDVPRPVAELTSEDVFKWLEVRSENKKETTISTWLSILSAFFEFCEAEEYIEQSPIKSRWRPRLPKPIPKYLEREDLASIRMQAESENLRNQTLFELLVSSGCRITEVLTLDKASIQLEERTATVKGKGGKIRTVNFSNRCQILLERHLQNIPEDTSIFLNAYGQPLTRVGAHKILRQMGRTAELAVPFGPHRLRHTFATTLLSKGADISFIADELGHKQLSTTRIYARLPSEELVRMYRKFMG